MDQGEGAEPFKNLAYAMKDWNHNQKNVQIKVLRALRNHERRLARIEKHLGIIPSPKELLEYNNVSEVEKEVKHDIIARK